MQALAYSWDDLAREIELTTDDSDRATSIDLVGDGHGNHVPGTPYVYRHWWVPLDGTKLGDDGIRRPAEGAAGRLESPAAAAVRQAAAGRTGAKGGRAWPLARVGRLRSGNEPGMTVAQEYQRKAVRGLYSVNDWERARRAGFAHPRDHQRDITEHIRQHGIVNPAQADYGTLSEGFHRYVAARQLGLRTLPVKKTG